MLNIDISGISNVIDPSKIDREGAVKALQILKGRTGEGSDFTGWLDLPYNYDNEEYARVKETAAEIRENADVFIIIGIGGSYLGSRMAIELIRSIRFNETKKPLIYFAGNGISGDATAELLELRDLAVDQTMIDSFEADNEGITDQEIHDMVEGIKNTSAKLRKRHNKV